MPNTYSRSQATVDQADIWSPLDLLEMDAVVAACALVAQADGWVTPEEAKRMAQRMGQSPAIALFGVHEVIAGFEALTARFEDNPDAGRAHAETAVRQLKPHAKSARWLVETACAVAEADGGFDGEERAALLRLCDLLEVDPRAFGLVASEEARQ